MQVKDALRQYVPPTAEHHGGRDCVAKPLSMNPYFYIEQHRLWPESMLASYGEKCRRALYVNGYHVLLCRRRIFIIRDEQVFSFPPFDSFVLDVYVENMDKDNLLVVIAHEDGVHVGKVRCESSTEVLEESFVPTSSPVARLHRLKKNLFCLCFADCGVQNMVVKEGGRGEVYADLQPTNSGWLATAASMLLPARKREYRGSFFDSPQGYLIVLSDREVTLWTYQDERNLYMKCSLLVPQETAAVIPASDRRGAVGSLVLRSGAKIGLTLTTKSKAVGPSLVMGPEVGLPSSLANLITVSEAREEANATLLYDDITCSLVVVGQESHAPSEPAIASQVNLPEKLSGIAFMGRSDVRDSGTFWLYTHGPVTFRVERVSMGTRLEEQFCRSRSDAVAFLNTLPPAQRSALVMEAALNGLPLNDLDRAIAPLLRPVLLDNSTMSLSLGAEGFVHCFMHILAGLKQLCAAAPYWELSDDLDKARRRASRSCALLRSYLRENGWLDYSGEIPRRAQWVKLHAISQDALNETTATHTQAFFLATLLSVVHHASTLAWEYSLLLRAGEGGRFSCTTMASLWDSADPAEAESTYVMDLLACDNATVRADITQRLLAEEDLLPRKAQLAVRVTSLIQENNSKGALDYASEHIQEIVRHDLFAYVADLLEIHALERLPRMRLLLQQYRADPTTSTVILNMLKAISLAVQGGAEKLKRNLECVFADEAAVPLHSVVLDWMESHSLDDERIEIFANIIASLDMDVNLSNTLTGTFFACWSQEVRGNMPIAARNFGKLARTQLECPLSARLLCATRARRYDPNDDDKHTEFILLLQRQLTDLLEEHLRVARARLVVPSEQIRLDLTALTQRFLDESALFDVAGRYHELGGASIQLDVLKIHNDAPEDVTGEALLAMLTFLKAAGRTGVEAVQMVLREYLHNFEGVLPLNPFIMFLAFDGVGARELAKVLIDSSVDARALFDVFLLLIDARGREPLFPVCDILQALVDIVEHVPAGQQNMCVSYLVECIRGMLAGEYRSLTLTQSDVFSLKAMAASLEKRLRRNR